MSLKELIEMYEKELQDILTYREVDKIRDIVHVHDRTEAEAIQRFIENLKNFDNEALLLPVGLLTLIHDINMNVIMSEMPRKTCDEFADIIFKVLDKHNLKDKYKDYVIKRFGGAPPNGL